MKKGLFSLLMLGSLTAFADVDFGKYCTAYLKGDLTDGVKPAAVSDFIPVEKEIEIDGKKVKSVVFKLEPDLEDIKSQPETKTVLNKKEGVEVQTLTVKAKNKRGKEVKDYTLVITRDLEGKILSIKKNNTLTDMKIGEKIDLTYSNGICVPSQSFKGLKREFKIELCRELEEFYDANPDAKSCIDKGYDMKVREIVEKHHRGLDKVTDAFRSKTYTGTMLSGKALGECFNAGLSDAVENDDLWKVKEGSSSSSEEGTIQN